MSSGTEPSDRHKSTCLKQTSGQAVDSYASEAPQKANARTKELFIVEGLSAASTLQQVINTRTQHILPLQGKLINVDKASKSRVADNEVCQKLLATLACGTSEECRIEHLVFSGIIILTDPDMDGTHSRLLLLKFFKEYLGKLLESGVVSIIIPPLFRIRFSPEEDAVFAWNDEEKQQLLEPYLDNNKADAVQVARLKGIAQFSRQECGALFLNPDSRRLLQVHLAGDRLQLTSGTNG